MTKLQGAHVVITGGSQGIGAAFAKEAHDAGARVSLLARGSEGLARAAAAISGAVKPVPARKAASALARGIERNSRTITADAATRALLMLGGLAEPVRYRPFTRTCAKARRQGSRRTP